MNVLILIFNICHVRAHKIYFNLKRVIFTAPASLESKSNASVGEVVVLAIGVCMVVIIALTIVVYVTCFKNGPRFGANVSGVVGPGGLANSAIGKDKKKQKLKFGDDYKRQRGIICQKSIHTTFF